MSRVNLFEFKPNFIKLLQIYITSYHLIDGFHNA